MLSRWQKGSESALPSLELLRGRLVTFLRENSVIRAEHEVIITPRGTPAKWLLDTRVALLNPEISVAISALYWEYMEKLYPFQMCCMELTGIPLMMCVQAYAMRCGFAVNGIIIRKEKKPNGRQRQIEGIINDLPLIFLDDIVNSGESIERAAAALSIHGKQIAQVVALVDFGTAAVGERLLKQGIHLKSLIALEELGVSKSEPTAKQDVSRQIFREVWKFNGEKHVVFDVVPKSTPALDNDRVYFATDGGHFYALNRLTGEVIWTFQVGKSGLKNIRSSPVLEGDLVYFGAYDGVLYALEKDTGKVRWQFIHADWIGSSPCCAHALNTLYVGLEYALEGHQGSLIALDLQSGERKWEFRIPGMVHSSPIFIEEFGCVVVGSNNGAIYCVDAVTGQERWSYITEGAIKSKPCYDEKRRLVIAGSFDKAVYAWAVDTGELAWKVCTEGVIYSEPLVHDDKVYVCSTDKYLHVLKAQDGLSVSRFFAGAKLYSSPIECGGRIYFASTSGCVYEFDLEAQFVVGTHFFSETITNKIQYDSQSNRCFVSTLDGQLFACERSI
jgi:outer membrane protein assembly factor BamB